MGRTKTPENTRRIRYTTYRTTDHPSLAALHFAQRLLKATKTSKRPSSLARIVNVFNGVRHSKQVSRCVHSIGCKLPDDIIEPEEAHVKPEDEIDGRTGKMIAPQEGSSHRFVGYSPRNPSSTPAHSPSSPSASVSPSISHETCTRATASGPPCRCTTCARFRLPPQPLYEAVAPVPQILSPSHNAHDDRHERMRQRGSAFYAPDKLEYLIWIQRQKEDIIAWHQAGRNTPFVPSYLSQQACDAYARDFGMSLPMNGGHLTQYR
ncbi:hypothetical protein JCM6882_001466 [Rhodosporidiobolus microsporus]